MSSKDSSSVDDHSEESHKHSTMNLAKTLQLRNRLHEPQQNPMVALQDGEKHILVVDKKMEKKLKEFEKLQKE